MAKQGRADRDVKEGWKREPNSNSINQGAVSRMGNMVGDGTPYKPFITADGVLKAPMKSQATRKGGSQGRY